MCIFVCICLCRGAELAVRIKYVTSPDPNQSAAVQWLEPAQTAGKKHPYLFTQCEVWFVCVCTYMYVQHVHV